MYFAAGDGPFYFAETIRRLRWLPVIWRADEGFGTNHGFRLWYDYSLQLVIKIFSSVGLTWWWIDKFLWIGAISMALYSSFTLGKYFFKKPYAYIVPLIYVANTYFLLLFSGGQLGVTWAYAYMPLVFMAFIKSLDENKRFSISKSVLRGFALALLIALDLRFAYLLIGAVVLYNMFYRMKHGIKSLWGSILDAGVSLLVAMGIHAFWILPTVLMGSTAVGGLDSEITNPGMLRFLSFADFPHSLALLHPNWPENLFGKVYFLQPEFLILPILAFSSLFFQKSKEGNKISIIFFGLLAIIGLFLSKGVQEPFGFVYQWMFTHLPGFVMFRDPTKFYVFTALGYSILIPFVLERINKKAAVVVFVVFWIFIIRAVFVGEVRGNLRPIQLPQEYVQLKNLLVADSVPSRTLWIPQQEKFAYASEVHPLLYADQLFPAASVSAVATFAHSTEFMNTLSAAGVRYVVVPQDVEQRLFLTDYRFDAGTRTALISALKNIPLIQLTAFHSVAVFENTTFTFIADRPASFERQQYFTNIGLIVSVIFLAASAGVLIIYRKQ